MPEPTADGLDGSLAHLHARDVTMLFVSRAPVDRLRAYKERIGSAMPWASVADGDEGGPGTEHWVRRHDEYAEAT